MADEYRHFDFAFVVNATPRQAFRAFTSVNALRDWFCDAAECDPRPGGRLYFWWTGGYHATGIFTEVEPDQRLAFTWRGQDEPSASSVRVLFSADGKCTRVRLVHGGIPANDPAWEHAVKAIKQGWQTGLENLVSVLESGIDLRQQRRPLLGVNLAEFNAEAAQKLGVPVSAGVRLSGVLPEMSASKAGLQADDVIVALDEYPVENYPALQDALRHYHAGDTARVSYFRGAERRQCELTFAERPVPSLPETPAALAESVRQVNADFQAQLAQALDGAGDDRAMMHPGPNQWNVKEELAHLILCERDLQTWTANMINDNEIADSLLYSPNVTPRLHALISVFPGLTDLQAELTRSHAETVALLERLPAEFAACKHMFNRIAEWMMYINEHNQEHLDEIKACLK